MLEGLIFYYREDALDLLAEYNVDINASVLIRLGASEIAQHNDWPLIIELGNEQCFAVPIKISEKDLKRLMDEHASSFMPLLRGVDWSGNSFIAEMAESTAPEPVRRQGDAF